jgi:hypothetical protein
MQKNLVSCTRYSKIQFTVCADAGIQPLPFLKLTPTQFFQQKVPLAKDANIKQLEEAVADFFSDVSTIELWFELLDPGGKDCYSLGNAPSNYNL